MPEDIGVEVVYALPDRQDLVSLRLPVGSRLEQAVEASGLLAKHGIATAGSKFGIYGKLSKLDAVLRDHDRIEIYRPLIADPKQVRKARAAEGKAKKAKRGSTPSA